LVIVQEYYIPPVDQTRPAEDVRLRLTSAAGGVFTMFVLDGDYTRPSSGWGNSGWDIRLVENTCELVVAVFGFIGTRVNNSFKTRFCLL
jgi:hypothetical protein